MTDDTETDSSSGDSNLSALMSDRQALQRVFIVLLALGVSVIFIWMIRGFLSPLFMAAVFAMFLNPVHRFLKPITFGSSSAAAGLVLVLAVFVVLIPLTAILALVADQAVQVTGTVAPWLQDQIRLIREGGIEALPDWLLAEAFDRSPHRGQIDHAGDAGKVLKQHSSWRERDLDFRRAGGIVVRKVPHIVLSYGARCRRLAKRVLEEHLD